MLFKKVLRVTAFTLGIHRFPAAVFMALGAGQLLVILIEREAGHGIVVEAQAVPFPALRAMTLVTVNS